MLASIANISLQQALYQGLFRGKNPRLCFKRDWLIRDRKFRTTWTAGWFLFQLQEGGPDGNFHPIRYPGSRDILDSFKGLLEESELAFKKQEKALGNRISRSIKAKLPMKLISLKYIADTIYDDAKAISPRTDNFLSLFEKDFPFIQKGLQHKLKKHDSIRRKLIAIAVQELHRNSQWPNYSLDLETCRKGVHDALRYTLVFDNDTYTASVKELERRLLDQPQWGVDSIKFKNYWCRENDQTTYMGINAQITLLGFPEIPRSRGFVIELQLHTPQSYELKENLTHKLFEKFRDPLEDEGEVAGRSLTGEAYKLALYKVLKQAMHFKDKQGRRLKAGDTGWWDHNPDQPFIPYLPEEDRKDRVSIFGYKGNRAHRAVRSDGLGTGRVKWVQLFQNKRRYEALIVEEKRKAAGVEIVLEPENEAKSVSSSTPVE